MNKQTLFLHMFGSVLSVFDIISDAWMVLTTSRYYARCHAQYQNNYYSKIKKVSHFSKLIFVNKREPEGSPTQ
jgi:hypothetical protein